MSEIKELIEELEKKIETNQRINQRHINESLREEKTGFLDGAESVYREVLREIGFVLMRIQ